MVVVGGISSPALSSKPSHKGLPALTASRCQTLQHFILNSSTVDGIVCISGIDSRYSPEAKTFTNFLLFGCSNYKGGSHSRYQNVDTDELIIVIKAHSIHVYGVPSVINAIMPQLSRLENLELLCLNDVENIDEDIVEDHKIHSFINMTRDLTKIAMPYSNAAPFNPMSVEKWPIIQAYALEDYGGNGFFTMGRDMSAFCPDALGLFQNFDLGSIRNLLSDSCLQIQYHWSTLIKNIQLSVQRDFTIDLESAIEPLVSYTTHGHVDAPKPLINLCSHPVTQKPLYVTCSVREPMGSVSCGRTYFICDKTNSPDLIVLSCLYEAASAHKGGLSLLVPHQRYLAVFGGIWRYLAVFGGIWRYLAVFGGIWRYLAVFGGIWRYLAVFGGIWRYLAVFGGIWRYLAVFGGIWRYLAVFGGIWRYLAVFGGIWRYLVFVCFMRHVSRVVVYGRRYISA